MTRLITRRTALIAAGGAMAMAFAAPRSALAATTHNIDMLNKSPDDPRARYVYSPRILVVQPGDSVHFVATDKGHDTVSEDEMIPAGAEGWKGKINEEITLTLDQPGFYGYRCTPHYTLGMVGLIIVEGEGMTANLEAAKAARQRGRAKATWDEIWAEVDGMNFIS
ncbi:MAG: pseudoazurin [Pseudomonadota bacterium]